MGQIRLHVREADGELPFACLSCGAPATVRVTKDMQWYPPWINVFFFAGVLPWYIVVIVMTKRARLQAPFCDQHKGHWLKPISIMATSALGLGALTVGLIVLARNLQPMDADVQLFMCIGHIASFVIWIVIVAIAMRSGIRPKEITDTEILLDGVSQEFIDIVAEEDRNPTACRREGRRVENDDEYGDQPRRARPPSDAIEE